MTRPFSRRDFVKASLLTSAGVPLGLHAQSAAAKATRSAGSEPESRTLPKGRIANLEFTRLILGGNPFAGWAHARQLAYVSTLMRRYHTPAKIRQTIELGEQYGITAFESWVMDDNSQLFAHWRNGGKMQWIAQFRLGQIETGKGDITQIQKAIDEGAVALHLTGDHAESLLDSGRFDMVGEVMEHIRSQKRVAGIAAHDLRVIVECEKRKMNVDFYQKTLHPSDYFGGPKPGDPDRAGQHDNFWCSDPQAVMDVFAKINKPWIAYKVLAAGGVEPRAGFPFAVNGGADFLLVGMFDWQVEENVKLAQRVFREAAGPNSKRTRPWCGGTPTA